MTPSYTGFWNDSESSAYADVSNAYELELTQEGQTITGTFRLLSTYCMSDGEIQREILPVHGEVHADGTATIQVGSKTVPLRRLSTGSLGVTDLVRYGEDIWRPGKGILLDALRTPPPQSKESV